MYLDGSYETILLSNPNEVEVIKYIQERCEPLLIATDVGKIPAIVYKIANFFQVEIFSPSKDLSRKQKKNITKDSKGKSDHERDALAAALMAYKVLGKRIKEIIDRFEKYKTYFIKAMIKGYLPSLPKDLFIDENKKEEKIYYEKNKVEKVTDVIIIERTVKKENPINKILYASFLALKMNKIPVLFVEDPDESWFNLYGKIIEGFPIYVKKIDKIKRCLSLLEKYEIPFIIVDKKDEDLKYYQVLSNEIKLEKFGEIFVVPKREFEKWVGKKIKDMLMKKLNWVSMH